MPLSTRLFSTEQVPESHLPSKSTNLYIPLSAAHPRIGGGKVFNKMQKRKSPVLC